MIKEYFCIMRKENMHQPFEVIHCKAAQSSVKELRYSFFQMAYVISGAGFLQINDNRISYNKGNLMLLTPDDRHAFTIMEATQFLFVKFNEKFVKEFIGERMNCIECLLYYASHMSGCILKNKPDEFLVKSIADNLLHCLKHRDIYHEELLSHYVNALIVIAARNISKIKPEKIAENTDRRMMDIIDYVQTHIYNPSDLRATVVAKKFGLSTTYLGSYFKMHAGETIQHFISHYKMRLIEHRLKFSDMRINEIVEEFGFSDESHLNKFFKKHRKLSLTQYRKQEAA